MATIKISVTGEICTVAQKVTFTAGSYGVYVAEVTTDASWDDLALVLCIISAPPGYPRMPNSGRCIKRSIPIKDGTAELDETIQPCMVSDNAILIGLLGCDADGKITRYSTVSAAGKVCGSGCIDDTILGDESRWAELISYINATINSLIGVPTDEQVRSAVDAYADEHGITTGATAEEAAQIEQNTTDITDLKSDLSQLSEEIAHRNGVKVVNSISEMVDTSTIYVFSTDGHWYYYNGAMWTDGGEFTGATISSTQIQSAVEDYLEENSQSIGTLTINGQTYDGSEDVEINIKDGSTYELPIATSETLGGVKPVAKTESMTQEVGVDEEGKLYTTPTASTEGSSSEGNSSSGSSDWELIGEVTSDGTGDGVGIHVPVDFTQYKEVFVVSKMIANTLCRVLICNTLAWYSGNIIVANGTGDSEITNVGTPSTSDVLTQSYILNVMGTLFPFSGWCHGYARGGRDMQPVASPRTALLATDFTYVRMDTNNNGAVPEGATLSVYGRK